MVLFGSAINGRYRGALYLWCILGRAHRLSSLVELIILNVGLSVGECGLVAYAYDPSAVETLRMTCTTQGNGRKAARSHGEDTVLVALIVALLSCPRGLTVAGMSFDGQVWCKD